MTVRAAALLTACLMWLGVAAPGHAETRLLVVVGLSGEPAFAEQFARWAATLLDAGRERYRLSDEQMTLLTAEPLSLPPAEAAVEVAGGAAAETAATEAATGTAVETAVKTEPEPLPADGRADKATIAATLAELAAATDDADSVLIFLLGHGNARDGEAWFNIAGPDLSAGEFADLLAPFRARLAVVNTTPASAPFVTTLAAPGRVVISATASASERFQTLFGGYFVDALAGDGADLNKDRRVSLLEAFDYARLEVERFYREQRRLQTEHALLDDNGDGEGSREPAVGAETDSGDPIDGALAYRFYLAEPDELTDAGPRSAELTAQKRALERRLELLRAEKTALPADEYDRRLEELLLELALLNRRLKAGDAAPASE